ncbi:MAG: putative phosphotransferase [Hyphomicrobiales bacterium]|nr:putative phosphotransferase [Hyphomicrobiales bacterium]
MAAEGLEHSGSGTSLPFRLEGFLVLPGSQSLPECAGNLCVLMRLALIDHLRVLRAIVLQRGELRKLHSDMFRAYGPAVRRAASAMTEPGRVVVIERSASVPIRLRAAPRQLEQTSVHGVGDKVIIFRLCDADRESILHVSTGAVSAAVVRRQLHGLATARAWIGPDLRGLVAQGVFLATTGDVCIMKQTALPGRSLCLDGLSPQSFQYVLGKALQPLHAIHARKIRAPTTFEHVEPTATRARLEDELAALMSRTAIALERWRATHATGSVLVHGDYWLGNVLFDGALGPVTGIVDWERCVEHGCPGLDALHLGVLSYAMWRKIPAAVLIADILSGEQGHEFCSSYAAATAQRFGLDSNDLRHVAALVWLSYVSAGLRDSHGFSNEWVAENVRHLEPTLSAWLSRQDV